MNDVVSRGINEDISTGVKSEGASRYPQASWMSSGIYITNQFKASEQLIISAGMRYTQFQLDAEFDTTFYPFPFTTANLNSGALTGSLGVVYHFAYKW